MKRPSLLIISGLALWACAGPAAPPASTPALLGPTRGLHITPDPISFPDTFVGCTRTVPVELKNSDPGRTLTVTAAASSDPSLRLEGALGLVLGPGQRRTLEARFTPAAAGHAEGSFPLATDEPGDARYGPSFAATGVEAPDRPLDLVFVLDVSTSMDEIAPLHGSLTRLFDRIETRSLDVRVGLTTFENEVIVHGGGAFLDRSAFFRELDSQLVEGTWVPDPGSNRHLLNLEPAENVLDALATAARWFDFRPDARRFFVLMTDDTFLEPPAVFSDGTPARHSCGQVAGILRDAGIQLFSIHSGQHGRGLSEDCDGKPSLVEQSGGTWLEIARADAASLDVFLDALLDRPDCR